MKRILSLIILLALSVFAIVLVVNFQRHTTRFTGTADNASMSNWPEIETPQNHSLLASLIPASATKTRINEAYGKLPLLFEANQGQSDDEARFVTRVAGYTLLLTADGAVMSLESGLKGDTQKQSIARETVQSSNPAMSTVLRMKLIGSNDSAQITGEEETTAKINYFLGNDPSRWRTDITTYTKVRYEAVYPGVDLVYYGNRQQLEYDFVIAPGSDPRKIKLRFDGADKLALDSQGDLLLQIGDKQLHQQKPLIYQDMNGARQEIAGGYELQGNRQISFKLGDYDASKPLIIDPVIVYSTYLNRSGEAIAVDASGNAYITGTNGDAFVTKINASGSAIVYTTNLGGASSDAGYGIAVDSSGNVYVAGYTDSTNFPLVNPRQTSNGGTADVFVARLNTSGSITYSTYLGGSNVDIGEGIAIDANNNIYITGRTQSPNFPTANAIQPTISGGGSCGAIPCPDAFIAKLDATGSTLIFSTYLGGSTSDLGQAVAVDSSGNAYATGWTDAGNFPTVNPIQPAIGGGNCGGSPQNPLPCADAFVTKLSANGALVYSTYLGGSGIDSGFGIAVDAGGNAYVTGDALGPFPTTPGAFQSAASGSQAFITKINPAGSGFVYSALAGLDGARGEAIAVDPGGNAYVAGRHNPGNGFFNAFAIKMNASGSVLLYNLSLGGAGDDRGMGIALDLFGNAYVTGSVNSSDFQIVNPLQTSGNGFVAKIAEAASPTPTPTPTSAAIGLSASTYAINEADASGVIVVTVNRTGDNSSAVSVNFTTSDQSGMTPCQTNGNGIASDRCDYATAAGTVRFAGGDTTKTIQIPIINDAYVEPNEIFTITLSNTQGAILGASTATVTIVDDDTQTATQNPINDQAFFIKEQYIDFLGRVAEPDGFNFWNNRMNGNPAYCAPGDTCDRVDTAKRFFESDEFRERGFYVYKLYDATLGRFPLYSEFVPEVARLNGPQTVAEQRLGKDAYLLDFMNKTEFKTLYDQYLSANHLSATNAAGFVNALCAKAGINPASKQTLIDNLQNGTRDPAHTLEDFILTAEINGDGTRFYDRARIVMQYFGFLRRDPDTGGFNFWWNRVATPGSPQYHDYRELVNNFLRSDEYNFRFAFIPAP